MNLLVSLLFCFSFSQCGPQNLSTGTSALDILFSLWNGIIPDLIEEINIILDNEKYGKCKYEKIDSFILSGWIAIWIEMGLSPKSNIKTHFNKNEGNTWIKNLGFGKDSWIFIFRALYHCQNDILSLVENLFNMNFVKYWTPFQRVTIDEMMSLFKGRSKNKIYEKSKPTKWGLKYYMGVDSEHYCFWFQFYQKPEEKQTGVTFDLCKQVIKKNNSLNFIQIDNKYTFSKNWNLYPLWRQLLWF